MSYRPLTEHITDLEVRIKWTKDGAVCMAHVGTRKLALALYSYNVESSIEAALEGLLQQLRQRQ